MWLLRLDDKDAKISLFIWTLTLGTKPSCRVKSQIDYTGRWHKRSSQLPSGSPSSQPASNARHVWRSFQWLQSQPLNHPWLSDNPCWDPRPLRSRNKLSFPWQVHIPIPQRVRIIKLLLYATECFFLHGTNKYNSIVIW